MREIFLTQKLNDGTTISVAKMRGLDLFNALLKTPDTKVMPFYLMCECMFCDGKNLKLEYILQLDQENVTLLLELMATQMNRLPKL